MAELLIRISDLRHNICFVQNLCAGNAVQLVVVAKGCNGFLPLLRLFHECGVKELAMSKVGDAIKAEPFLSNPPMFLSVPAPQQADSIIRHFGSSLNSEFTTIQALGEAAKRNGRSHGVILMVDIGDRREGVIPEDLMPLVISILDLRNPFIKILGIGATLGCCCGTLPDRDNMEILVQLAEEMERQGGIPVQSVSLGGSVILPWLESGTLPTRINQVRIGEAILLGNIPTIDKLHQGLSSRGFVLRGTVLEVKKRPSLPAGIQGKDVLGRKLSFVDRGPRLRCLVDFGLVDTYPRGLKSELAGLEFVNSNSDYTIFDITEVDPHLRPGETIDFTLNYQSLIRALHSQHLKITIIE